MKEKVFLELMDRTKENVIEENKVFTAADIALSLNIGRNTVSQYLNEKVKQGEAIKINTRPVYFFARNVIEEKMIRKSDQDVYESFDDFINCFREDKMDFENLIGYNNSLKSVVDHCKAAVTYPGGLPILIQGPTGTGKSMIASMMYDYALNQKIIDKDKRFIAVNCSEYANNPELLTTNLFGNVKGAYTGADEDNEGLIALADGGILFLDEVHCLKAECQEKLFFFMDKQMYHKVGDNDNWYTSKCRLVFATTENPQNALLKTLLRRIPIIITVPSLKERPLIEKRELIYEMFHKESKRLNKEILISNLAYQTLMDFEFIGNVGTLKNAIKGACANSFLLNKESKKLKVKVKDLPEYIFSTLKTMQLKSTVHNTEENLIPISTLKSSLNDSSFILKLYQQILNTYIQYEKMNDSFDTYKNKVSLIIEHYIDYVMFHGSYLNNTNEEYLLKLLDKIFSIVMNKYSLAIPNNEIKIYSKILLEYSKSYTDTNIWTSENKEIIDKMMNELQEYLPRAFNIATEIIDNIKINLDIEVDNLLLFMITVSFEKYQDDGPSSYGGVILCHGYSTASSIAETVNRMLGQYIFDGIDMEINISIDKIAKLVEEYIKRKSTIKELIFLVDMGSLEAIYKKIKPVFDYNIGIINNVSTGMALSVGNDILQGKCIEEVLEHINEKYKISTHFVKSRKKQKAILSICATGFGAAQKICELLIMSLPRKIDLVIIPYNYKELVENGTSDLVFNRYDVDLIIGTLDPKIENIPFMAIESVMMNDEFEIIEQIMKEYLNNEELVEFRKNITKNFTLSNIVNHLTILNGEKIINDVEEIVTYLENDLKEELDATKKVGLYIHISCLIERLILKQAIDEAKGMETQVENEKERIQYVKNAFSGVSERYSVEISDIEALFILNYFK